MNERYFEDKNEFRLNELYSANIAPVGFYMMDLNVRTRTGLGYKAICYKIDDENYYDIVNDIVFKDFNATKFEYIENHRSDYYVANEEYLFITLKHHNINFEKNVINRDEIKYVYDILNKFKSKNQKQPKQKEHKTGFFKRRKLKLSDPFFKQVLSVRGEISDSLKPELIDEYIYKLNKISNSYSNSLIEHYDLIKENPSYETKIMEEYISLLDSLRADIKHANELAEFSNSLLDDLEILGDNIDKPSLK